MKIAALVTSYNDPFAARKCVDALLKQTHPLTAILVIDNSTIQTLFAKDFDSENFAGTALIISHFPENIGVSGAIHEGLEFAVEYRCSHLWTFDQDSIPQPDAAEKLLEILNFDEHRHRGLYSSLPYDEGQKRYLFGYRLNRFKFEEIKAADTHKPYDCDGTITAGMLIPITPMIGALLPKRELFIDGVDHSLCLNFVLIGCNVRMVPESRIIHHMGQPAVGKLFLSRFSRTVHNYSPLRKFYIARNHSYLETRAALREGVLLNALFWRVRVAYHMFRESLYERGDWLWASVWAIVLGTLLGICGKLVPYNKLHSSVRKLF